jgi:hypothetical protein
MRVSMTYTPTTSNNEPLPCGNLTYGEIEDYCVTLSNEVHVDTHETSLYSFSPNPASHHIQFKTHCEKPQQIFIYTTDGRLAMDASLTAWPSLDVTALSSGLYYISVQNHQQQRFTLPLVIHE